MVLTFSVVDSSSPHVRRNRGCHSFVFANFSLNQRNEKDARVQRREE